MAKRLPVITHLQFLILDALAEDEQAGRDLRDRLAAHGVRNSAPAFYQMMGRLEESDLVEGWYEQRIVGGQTLKERRYRLTKSGLRALADTRNFYVARFAASSSRKAHA